MNRLLLVSLVIVLIVSVTATSLVIAAEITPEFVTKWVTFGTGDGQFDWPLGGR